MRVLVFGKGGISGGIKKALAEHEVIELTKDDCDVRDAMTVFCALGDHKPEWVINCAGISKPDYPKLEIETNLQGAMNVALMSAPIPQIHIASVAGLYGKPGHLGYSVSKAGVITMVQSLGFEYSIWAISPGRVDTPMREKDYPNDTPGSRLDPLCVGVVVQDIMSGYYQSGANIIIRKVGLDDIRQEVHLGDGWKQKLRVGQSVTI